jgi:thioredoxin-related protein
MVVVPMLFKAKNTAYYLDQILKKPKEKQFGEVLDFYKTFNEVSFRAKRNIGKVSPEMVKWLNQIDGLAQKYEVPGTPSYLYIGKDGKIHFDIEVFKGGV